MRQDRLRERIIAHPWSGRTCCSGAIRPASRS